MSNEREFVRLTAGGRPLPVWLRVWLTIAAFSVGAILLWLGMVLALVVVLALALALIPVWAWKKFATRTPTARTTIEGDYTVTEVSVTGDRQPARDRTAGDVEHPRGRP